MTYAGLEEGRLGWDEGRVEGRGVEMEKHHDRERAWTLLEEKVEDLVNKYVPTSRQEGRETTSSLHG